VEISVRPTKLEDMDEIMQIEKEVYGAAVTRETFESLVKVFPEGFLVAEDLKKHKIAGYIGFERIDEIKAIPYVHEVHMFHTAEGKNAYLEAFGVAIKYQKKGVGELLYKSAIDKAKCIGCKTFVVLCNKEDPEDQYEISLLLHFKFVERMKKDWEIYPGHYRPHSIWVKML